MTQQELYIIVMNWLQEGHDGPISLTCVMAQDYQDY